MRAMTGRPTARDELGLAVKIKKTKRKRVQHKLKIKMKVKKVKRCNIKVCVIFCPCARVEGDVALY